MASFQEPSRHGSVPPGCGGSIAGDACRFRREPMSAREFLSTLRHFRCSQTNECNHESSLARGWGEVRRRRAGMGGPLPATVAVRQGGPLDPRGQLHGLLLLECLCEGRDHRVGNPEGGLPEGGSGPPGVRAPGVPARRHLFVVRLQPHPREAPLCALGATPDVAVHHPPWRLRLRPAILEHGVPPGHVHHLHLSAGTGDRPGFPAAHPPGLHLRRTPGLDPHGLGIAEKPTEIPMRNCGIQAVTTNGLGEQFVAARDSLGRSPRLAHARCSLISRRGRRDKRRSGTSCRGLRDPARRLPSGLCALRPGPAAAGCRTR